MVQEQLELIKRPHCNGKSPGGIMKCKTHLINQIVLLYLQLFVLIFVPIIVHLKFLQC